MLNNNLFQKLIPPICLLITILCLLFIGYLQTRKTSKIVSVNLGNLIVSELKRGNFKDLSQPEIDLRSAQLMNKIRKKIDFIAKKHNLIIISQTVALGGVKDLTEQFKKGIQHE